MIKNESCYLLPGIRGGGIAWFLLGLERGSVVAISVQRGDYKKVTANELLMRWGS